MFELPYPSRATRSIPGSSPYNYRGSIIDHERNVELSFESGKERNALLLWLASPDITEIQEQPAAVEYYDEDGVFHHHTFDFRAVTRDGVRALVDVKPAALVEHSNILAVQKLIRQQHGTRLADRFLLMTEENMHPRDVKDAKAILRACRMPNPEADKQVSRLIRNTTGWMLIDEIVEVSGLKAEAYNAVLRMIRARALKSHAKQTISYDAYVRRINTLN